MSENRALLCRLRLLPNRFYSSPKRADGFNDQSLKEGLLIWRCRLLRKTIGQPPVINLQLCAGMLMIHTSMVIILLLFSLLGLSSASAAPHYDLQGDPPPEQRPSEPIPGVLWAHVCLMILTFGILFPAGMVSLEPDSH